MFARDLFILIDIKSKSIIMTDYKKGITVNKPVNEVYRAITEHISDWWSNDLTGAAAKKRRKLYYLIWRNL